MSTLTVVTSASAYVLALFKDVFLLVAQLTIELLAGVRVLYLHAATQRRPGQRSEHDAAITRLRQARARRWEPWRKLPATRRVVVSAATLMTVAILVWAAGRDGNAADPAADQVVMTETPDPGAPETAPPETAERFTARVAALRPGEWAAYSPPVIVRGALNTWADGNAWRQCEPWKGFPELQSGLVAANPSVARMKDGVWLWFAARSAQGVEEIRVAYRSGAL